MLMSCISNSCCNSWQNMGRCWMSFSFQLQVLSNSPTCNVLILIFIILRELRCSFLVFVNLLPEFSICRLWMDFFFTPFNSKHLESFTSVNLFVIYLLLYREVSDWNRKKVGSWDHFKKKNYISKDAELTYMGCKFEIP